MQLQVQDLQGLSRKGRCETNLEGIRPEGGGGPGGGGGGGPPPTGGGGFPPPEGGLLQQKMGFCPVEGGLGAAGAGGAEGPGCGPEHGAGGGARSVFLRMPVRRYPTACPGLLKLALSAASTWLRS